MKRSFICCLLLIVTFSLCILRVNAKLSFKITPVCTFDKGDPSESNGTESCEFYIESQAGANGCNNVYMSFVLENLKLESHKDEANWTFVDNGNNSYTLKYSGNSLPVTSTKITTLTFTKNERAEVCHLTLDTPTCDLTKTTCKQVDGTYYGKSGNSVSADQFDLECNEHKCEEVQGHYFGPNGDTITESQYKVDCDHVKCEKLPDGRFVDKSGLIVPYIDYRKSCETIKCEVLPDGTRYDNEGNIVEEDEFRESCGDVCYQDSEGKYHGKTGEEVDSVTYQKECGNNVCQAYPDGTYSDPEGKETTKEDYELKCKKHVCEKIGDNYFDDKGNPVTKEQFNKACPAGEIPKTGVSLPIISILVLSASGILLLLASKKSNKFMD